MVNKVFCKNCKHFYGKNLSENLFFINPSKKSKNKCGEWDLSDSNLYKMVQLESNHFTINMCQHPSCFKTSGDIKYWLKDYRKEEHNQQKRTPKIYLSKQLIINHEN